MLAEVETPALDALIADGTWTDAARTGLPTVSGPGWSSFLIGVWSDKHGVTDNSFEGERYAAYPDFLTRIEQVRPELATFAVADWLPLGRLRYRAPHHQRRDRREGRARRVRTRVAGRRRGLGRPGHRTPRAADPDALFVYLGNPDEVSHGAGSIGDEYRAAIAQADGHVARSIEAVRARPDLRATRTGSCW